MTVLGSSESFWKLVILSLGAYYFQIRTTRRIAGNVLFFFEIHMWDFEPGMANSIWNHVIQIFQLDKCILRIYIPICEK